MYPQQQWQKPCCDLCRGTRGIIYCKSDSARLCLSCDHHVHSANSLARSHKRALICDTCNLGNAVTQCNDDKLSLCEDCDGKYCSDIVAHSRQILGCYTGCPSTEEICASLFMDQTNSDQWPVLNLKDRTASTLNENENFSMLHKGDCIDDELDMVINENNIEIQTSVDHHIDQKLVSIVSPPKTKNLGVPYNDNLYQELNLESLIKDQIQTLYQAQCQFKEDMENIQIKTRSNVSMVETNPMEVHSFSDETVTFPSPFAPIASSSFIGMSSMMNPNSGWTCKKSINLGMAETNAFQLLPKETTTVATDNQQDCSSWSKLLSVEEPWEANVEVRSPKAREKAKRRYIEKRKLRKFEKQIRYASRKARAETRKRVKGRFVKAGDEYDYNPVPSADSPPQ